VTRGYREDIDWLRAIAVMAVIAFHFEVTGVYGGFVGVDIFFVISGYLIAGGIRAEVERNSFSFLRFYELRLRRLFPALFVMIAATAIPSLHYLLPSERTEFFRSIAAVVTFTSNFFFYFQTGYFDHAAVEKPLLHTWSLAVEEQFYLTLPLLLWALYRGFRSKLALSATLGVIALISFVLSIWLMNTGRSAEAFFMSPPRAWEFLMGGLLATPGLPILRNPIAQRAVRGVALVVLAIPIFALRQGPGFPGFNALAPCIGAAMFIWSGIGTVSPKRGRHSPLEAVRLLGRISYSLYLWHWPLFTFARFASNGLVLGPFDKVTLFTITLLISCFSWRFVEQPFRLKAGAPTRPAIFLLGGAASALLLVGSVVGVLASRTPSETDRVALQLAPYDDYDYRSLYRYGTCFAPAGDVFGDACLRLAPDKTNVMLWGDSLAAHYFSGLQNTIDSRSFNILQATQPACMPTFNAAAQGTISCRRFDEQMDAFFANHKPDLVIIAADWMEYSRSPRFDGMIADLKRTLAKLSGAGINVVLLGPPIQFKSRLPSMLMRARLRHVDARPDDFVLPYIFTLDEMMKAALPAREGFSYVSVIDAVCPAKQCPLTVAAGIPLAWDHAHLTAEGSAYVINKLKLGMPGLSHQ